MIWKFIQLEWKHFFRSSYWKRSIGLNILLIFFSLYLLLVFMSIGVSGYFLLKEKYPGKDPLRIVNAYLIFWFLGDLIVRYMSQKIPEMQVRPFLNLPFKKYKIAQYILFKSSISFFVWLPFILFVPFAAVLYYKGFPPAPVTAWLISVLALTIANNYLNFTINKNKQVLYALIGLSGILVLGNYFKFINVQKWITLAFDQLNTKTWLAVVPVLWAVLMIFVAYKNILKHLYLDDILQTGRDNVSTADLSFTNRLGELGIYYKNELRSLWRNKRSKNVVYNLLFVPFVGLLYIKINQDKSPDQILMSFMTAAFFITMLTNVSYGQFIPSLDSAHYPFIMGQNINLKKYLEAKYLLLSTFSIILFIFSTPYLYFGWQYLAILFAFTVFTLGIINPLILWNGAYNTKRIDANEKAFGNTQGVSSRSMLAAFLFGVFPFIIFIILFKTLDFNSAILIFITIGIIGILSKNIFLKKLSRLYRQKKYKTLHGFKQLN